MSSEIMKRAPWMLRVGLPLLLALVLAAIWTLRPAPDPVVALLPTTLDEADIPVALRERLENVRATIREPRRDADGVRRLAHLYHANRYYIQAQQCYDLLA